VAENKIKLRRSRSMTATPDERETCGRPDNKELHLPPLTGCGALGQPASCIRKARYGYDVLRPKQVLGFQHRLGLDLSRRRWWRRRRLPAGFPPFRRFREPGEYFEADKRIDGQCVLRARIREAFSPTMKRASGNAEVFHRPRDRARLDQESLEEGKQILQHWPAIAEAPARRAEATLV
jgi:hypothetical protein